MDQNSNALPRSLVSCLTASCGTSPGQCFALAAAVRARCSDAVGAARLRSQVATALRKEVIRPMAERLHNAPSATVGVTVCDAFTSLSRCLPIFALLLRPVYSQLPPEPCCDDPASGIVRVTPEADVWHELYSALAANGGFFARVAVACAQCYDYVYTPSFTSQMGRVVSAVLRGLRAMGETCAVCRCQASRRGDAVKDAVAAIHRAAYKLGRRSRPTAAVLSALRAETTAIECIASAAFDTESDRRDHRRAYAAGSAAVVLPLVPRLVLASCRDERQKSQHLVNILRQSTATAHGLHEALVRCVQEVLQVVGERNTFRMWVGVARRCTQVMSEIIGATAAAAIMHASWVRLAANTPGAATIAVLGLDAALRRMALHADALGVAAALFSASADAERHAAAEVYFNAFVERLFLYDSAEQLVRSEALTVQSLVAAAPGSLGTLASKIASVLQSTSSFVQPKPDAFVVVVPHHLWPAAAASEAPTSPPDAVAELRESFAQANASVLERRRLTWQAGYCSAVIAATWSTGSLEIRGAGIAVASALLQLSGQPVGYAVPMVGRRGQFQRLADAGVVELRRDTVSASALPPRAGTLWLDGDRGISVGRATFSAPKAVTVGPREGSQVIQAAACRALKRSGPMAAEDLLAFLQSQRADANLTVDRLQLELRELVEREYIRVDATGLFAYIP